MTCSAITRAVGSLFSSRDAITKTAVVTSLGTVTVICVIEAGINYANSNMTNGGLFTACAAIAGFWTGYIVKNISGVYLAATVRNLATLPPQFLQLFQNAQGQEATMIEILANVNAFKFTQAATAAGLTAFLTKLSSAIDKQEKLLTETNITVIELKNALQEYKTLAQTCMTLIGKLGALDTQLKASAEKAADQYAKIVALKPEVDKEAQTAASLVDESKVQAEALKSLNTTLPQLVGELQESLTTRGQELVKLQQEVQDLKQDAPGLESTLKKVQAERAALKEEQEKVNAGLAQIAAFENNHRVEAA